MFDSLMDSFWHKHPEVDGLFYFEARFDAAFFFSAEDADEGALDEFGVVIGGAEGMDSDVSVFMLEVECNGEEFPEGEFKAVDEVRFTVFKAYSHIDSIGDKVGVGKLQ